MAKRRKSPADQGSLSLFTSHYEEDFLFRTLGDLIRKADVALGELVANAWDAGAERVAVVIPERSGEPLSVEDDGCGLTVEQFDQRWMTLSYNRQKHQGADAEFPPGRTGRRRAYGRNGQGRHGLFCFANTYTAETLRAGALHIFEVRVSSGAEPFASRMTSKAAKDGHGMRLSVIVERNRPDPDRIREVLASRFLHDPKFAVTVNGKSLPFTELPGFGGKRDLTVVDPVSKREVHLELSTVESEVGRTKHQSGVAFWVGNRLVGEPGWNVLGTPVLDGRTRPGRRLTFVVQTEDLHDEVLPDWTDFKKTDLMKGVGETVIEAVRETLRTHYAERVQETTREVMLVHGASLEVLQPGERLEVKEAVEAMAHSNPLVAEDVLSAAVEGIIEAKRKASVQALVRRLELLLRDDIEGIHRLLDEWSVRDALTVLDEIGRRIKVVEALEKLMGEQDVDELRVLHPLLTQARWLFGAEYDSPLYASNVGLRNAMKKVFGVDASAADFHNPRKRPDLLVLPNATLSAVATEDFEPGASVTSMRRVLLVELKRGGYTVGRKEMSQAEGYIEDLLNSGHVTGSPFIHAFVVGYNKDSLTTDVRTVGKNPEKGVVEAATFAQLVQTANMRLFKLREHVQERYPESGNDLVERIEGDAKTAEQLGLPLRVQSQDSNSGKVDSRVLPSVPKSDEYQSAVPVYDLAVAAGKFSDSQSPEPIGWMRLKPSRPLQRLMFVARVVGRSMEDGIPNGSWALFRQFPDPPSPTGIDGKRIVVQLRETDPDTGGKYTLKRWHVARYGDDGGIETVELRPDNPDFKSIMLSAKDGEIQPIAEFLEIVS